MKKLFCLCASLLLVAACSKKNDPVENAKVAIKDKDLQGKSFSRCDNSSPLGIGESIRNAIMAAANKGDANATPTYSERTSWKFEGNRVYNTTEYYAQNNCQGDPNYQIEESGTFDVQHDDKHKTNDNGYPMDLELTTLKVKINTDGGAANATNAKLCDVAQWKKGEEKTVTGASKEAKCYGTVLPRKVVNLYRVDDKKKLSLGKVAAQSNSEKDRPKTLQGATEYEAK